MFGDLWDNSADSGTPPVPLTPEELGGSAKIVGVYSPASGAGATTVACLCSLLAGEEMGLKVALVDLVPRGKVRTYMGLTPDECPASLLDIEGVENPEEVEGAGVQHPRNVFVIPGVIQTLEAVRVDTKLSLKVLAFLKQRFDLVVAVLGPLYWNGWAVAMVCDELFVVVRPCRADLDMYIDDAGLLEKLGCSGKTKVILNQVGQQGMILEDDVRKLLSPVAVIPYLPEIQSGCNKRYLTVPKKQKKVLLSLIPDITPEENVQVVAG